MQVVTLLGLCWLSAGVACSADDDLGDDPAGDDEVAVAGSGGASGASGAAGASMGGSSAGAAGANASDEADTSDESNDEQQPDPVELDDGATEGETGIFVGMTAAHNAARAAVDVDPPLPDLTWSTELAAVAQDWADHLTSTECGSIEHRQPNMYGENIAMRGSSRLVEAYPPEEAVAGWDAEVACWDYGTISGTETCDVACVGELFSNGCGHYTQLVWRGTQRVGCGYSTCEGDYSYEVWVCNYDPPGNVRGRAPY